MTDDAFPDALPHQYRLHWYVLESVLGQGGFGITYLARDTNLGRQVAIKEYLPGDVAQRRSDATVRPRTEPHGERYRWGLERFIGEAQTLARFDHANIVRVLAVFEANDTAYMVMRFEEGENLGSLLEQRGTLPEAELLRILLPILGGLQLVHDARFIHRDIKPENIHIRRDGSPVLLDFGSARESLNRTQSMTVLVARGYAPLEQYYGDPDSQGAWTDIYSLAATCYRAIAGKAPADALERIKGVLGSVREVLTPATEIGRGRYSERLLQAIDHALELSEKDRPQSIAQWRQELVAEATVTPGQSHRLGEVTPVSTVNPPKMKVPGRSPRSRLRRDRILWAAGGAAGAAIAIAIFAGIQYQQNRDDQRQQEHARQQDRQRQDEQNRQRQEEARKREDDRVRRDAEERQRLLAQLEAQQRQVEAGQKVPPPAPRLRNEDAQKMAARKPAVVTKVEPRAVAEPPKSAFVPPALPPVPVQEPAAGPAAIDSSSKQAVAEPSRKPAVANLIEQAEAALGRSDYATALPLIKRLASAGDARGQALLGRFYENGLGMPKNTFAAYMWYSLAARGGNAAASGMKERVAGALQPAELRQADHAVDRWKPQNDESGAATR